MKLLSRYVAFTGETLEGLIPVMRGQTLGSNLTSIDFSGVTTFALPSGTTLGGSSLALSALGPISSTSANAFAVGPNATATTNPTFNVDCSTSSAATGLNIKSAAAGAGLAVSVITSGTNENLTIDASGSGTITFGATSTGAIAMSRALNVTPGQSTTALTVGRTGSTYAFQVDTNTGSSITGIKLTAAATGNGVALIALGGTNEAVKIDGKGTGAIGINTTSTTSGLVTLGNTTSLAGAFVNGPLQGSIKLHASAGATETLDATMVDSLILFDRASGVVYTLPTPVAGMIYNFYISTTITSGAAEVDTSSGSVFIGGAIQTGIGASATTLTSLANGTSHVKISMNGTTTGGIKGTYFSMVALDTTHWLITGMIIGSGSIATPFA